MNRTRTLVETVRAAIGVGHAVRVLRGSAHPALDTALAVRQIGQALLVGRAGSGRAGSADAHTLSALVDALHGASMVPLAVADPRRRRFAAAQIGISLVLVVAEGLAVGAGRGAVGGRR